MLLCQRIPNFVDAGFEIGIFHCFTAFSGDRRHVDLEPSAELTRQVEKSTRRAYQAPMPVDLQHEQAHKLMSSMALSRLDVLGLSTDHCLHRLLLRNGASCSIFDMGCASQWSSYPAVTCLVSCSPEGYEKLYLLRDGFSIFSYSARMVRQWVHAHASVLEVFRQFAGLLSV